MKTNCVVCTSVVDVWCVSMWCGVCGCVVSMCIHAWSTGVCVYMPGPLVYVYTCLVHWCMCKLQHVCGTHIYMFGVCFVCALCVSKSCV